MVVPSIGHESFGLVTVEAFARGIPAVVNRLGALAELADETGAALAYSGERELDDALARLAGDARAASGAGPAGARGLPRAVHAASATWTATSS